MLVVLIASLLWLMCEVSGCSTLASGRFVVAVGLPMGQETGCCFARDLLGSIHQFYQATAIIQSL
jgi:hypothetical protein